MNANQIKTNTVNIDIDDVDGEESPTQMERLSSEEKVEIKPEAV